MRTFSLAWLLTYVLILNLPSLPSNSALVVSFAVLLLAAKRFERLRTMFAGVFAAVFFLGFSLSQTLNHQLLPDQIATELDLNVSIASVPRRDDARVSFIADVLACNSCQQSFGPKRLRLNWYGHAPMPRAGEQWRLLVKLKPPTSLRNPGQFDATKWAMTSGIHARGYVRQSQWNGRIRHATGWSVVRYRQYLSEQLALLPSANSLSGFVSALALGIRHGIDDAERELLRDTGTAHLLAISGLHISLVALWGFIAGKMLTRCCSELYVRLSGATGFFEPRLAGLLLSIGSALVYAVLAGFELPVQRSVVMICVWVAAAWYFRFLPPGAALCIALIAVMVLNPLNPLTVGFWLSFGTVSMLFYLHHGRQSFTDHASAALLSRVVNRSLPVARTHLLISVFLLPVTAWFFQSGSFVAPLANVLAVPWTGLIVVPMSLISVALGSVSPVLADYSLQLAQGSIRVLLNFLRLLDDHLPASMPLTLPSATAFVLSVCGLLSLFAPRGLGIRWLAIPLIAPAVIFNLQREPIDGFELHVLDVGQGLAALIYTDQQTLLFDTGGKVSRSLSMFEAVVVPYLHASGRRHIDTLIVSHGDEDHAFGVQDLVNRFPAVQIISSKPLDLPASVEQQRCVAGDAWSVADVSFAFLHPAPEDTGSKNNLSCVLFVYTGSSRVLLTGDIEADAERRLAERMAIETDFDLTVLVAPHHGSSTSSSQPLMDTFDPEYVVFAAGRRNRYGFPHADVQLRYNLLGSHSYITGQEGSVSFHLGESGLYHPPDTWWKSHRRFWHGIINPDCWPVSASQSQVLRMLELAQKGQTLCGK